MKYFKNIYLSILIAISLFQLGCNRHTRETKNIILPDTIFEFGLKNNELIFYSSNASDINPYTPEDFSITYIVQIFHIIEKTEQTTHPESFVSI